MKRDPRLHGLSSDHHSVLVLAQRLAELASAGLADAATAREIGETFERKIAPHFAVEEEVLLPAMRSAGEDALVQRTERDHAFLRERAHEARDGRPERLGELADRLRAHVRFEEQELFPRCEEVLDDRVLEEVARRAPHGS
jgi:hemerythrin-like domain-containing protein